MTLSLPESGCSDWRSHFYPPERLHHLRAGIVEDELVSRFVEAGGWYSAEVVFAVREGYPRFALAIATNALTRLGEEWVGSNHQGT